MALLKLPIHKAQIILRGNVLCVKMTGFAGASLIVRRKKPLKIFMAPMRARDNLTPRSLIITNSTTRILRNAPKL